MVQQSTTVAEAQGNEQKANNVDAAMDKLRQSIADNATTKQNQIILMQVRIKGCVQ